MIPSALTTQRPTSEIGQELGTRNTLAAISASTVHAEMVPNPLYSLYKVGLAPFNNHTETEHLRRWLMIPSPSLLLNQQR